MNDLSWLLYLADVTGNVGAFLAFTAIGSFVGAGACAFGGHMNSDYGDEEVTSAAFSWAKRLLLVALIAGGVATFIPSKQTVYAIAASEVGEEALKTPVAGKAARALEAWLDAQIKKSEQATAAKAEGRS